MSSRFNFKNWAERVGKGEIPARGYHPTQGTAATAERVRSTVGNAKTLEQGMGTSGERVEGGGDGYASGTLVSAHQQVLSNGGRFSHWGSEFYEMAYARAVDLGLQYNVRPEEILDAAFPALDSLTRESHRDAQKALANGTFDGVISKLGLSESRNVGLPGAVVTKRGN